MLIFADSFFYTYPNRKPVDSVQKKKKIYINFPLFKTNISGTLWILKNHTYPDISCHGGCTESSPLWIQLLKLKLIWRPRPRLQTYPQRLQTNILVYRRTFSTIQCFRSHVLEIYYEHKWLNGLKHLQRAIYAVIHISAILKLYPEIYVSISLKKQ